MSRVLILVLMLIAPVSLYSEDDPTSLLPSAIQFSTGGYIYDAVDESIPPTNLFPEASSYTVYGNWYEEQLAPGPGTINVIVEGSLISGIWMGPDFDTSDPRVFSGTRELPDPNGIYTEGGSGNDGNANAWSEVRLQDRTFGDIMYLNADNNYSYIRYYKDLQLNTPINPGSIGLNVQADGGVSFLTDVEGTEEVRLHVDSNARHVGIGTSSPQAELHIAGGDVRFSGSMFGKLGEFSTFTNSTKTFDQTTEGVGVEEVLIGDGTTTRTTIKPNNAAVIFAMASFTYITGTNNGSGGTISNKDDAKVGVRIRAEASAAEVGDTYSPITYADMDATYNDGAAARVMHVVKNTTDSDIYIDIQLLVHKKDAAMSGVNLGQRVTAPAGKSSLGVFVIPYVD
jgi:hypothetical protein